MHHFYVPILWPKWRNFGLSYFKHVTKYEYELKRKDSLPHSRAGRQRPLSVQISTQDECQKFNFTLTPIWWFQRSLPRSPATCVSTIIWFQETAAKKPPCLYISSSRTVYICACIYRMCLLQWYTILMNGQNLLTQKTKELLGRYRYLESTFPSLDCPLCLDGIDSKRRREKCIPYPS